MVTLHMRLLPRPHEDGTLHMGLLPRPHEDAQDDHVGEAAEEGTEPSQGTAGD